MADKASKAAIDFTNVKDGGTFNKKRQPEGDYRGKILKVADATAKDNTPQWLFTITAGSGTYPYYCKHQENQFWKIRNLLVACGINVPKKKVNVDPNDLVGRSIAVTLEDDEYEGKAQSNIAATFPLSELDESDAPDQEEDEEDDEETPAPAPKKKTPPPVEDDDDDEEDDTPPPPKKKKAPAPVEEDDEDEDDEPAPPVKKKKAPAPPDDDDLEEIDIDDT